MKHVFQNQSCMNYLGKLRQFVACIYTIMPSFIMLAVISINFLSSSTIQPNHIDLHNVHPADRICFCDLLL